jgi:hypothetical protein
MYHCAGASFVRHHEQLDQTAPQELQFMVAECGKENLER